MQEKLRNDRECFYAVFFSLFIIPLAQDIKKIPTYYKIMFYFVYLIIHNHYMQTTLLNYFLSI